MRLPALPRLSIPRMPAEMRLALTVLTLAVGCAGSVTAGVYVLFGLGACLLSLGAFCGLGAFLIARGAG